MDNLIKAIASKDLVKVKKYFNEAMELKLKNVIQERKLELASSVMVVGEKSLEDDEEHEEDAIEDDEEHEDDLEDDEAEDKKDLDDDEAEEDDKKEKDGKK